MKVVYEFQTDRTDGDEGIMVIILLAISAGGNTSPLHQDHNFDKRTDFFSYVKWNSSLFSYYQISSVIFDS